MKTPGLRSGTQIKSADLVRSIIGIDTVSVLNVEFTTGLKNPKLIIGASIFG